MPSNKFKTRFPPARIKKIMQTDEEVGKVAAPVPVIVSKSVELFTEILLHKSGEIAASRGARTLSIDHIKQCVEQEQKFDFLREIVQEAAAKAVGKTGDDSSTPTASSYTGPPRGDITDETKTAATGTPISAAQRRKSASTNSARGSRLPEPNLSSPSIRSSSFLFPSFAGPSRSFEMDPVPNSGAAERGTVPPMFSSPPKRSHDFSTHNSNFTGFGNSASYDESDNQLNQRGERNLQMQPKRTKTEPSRSSFYQNVDIGPPTPKATIPNEPPKIRNSVQARVAYGDPKEDPSAPPFLFNDGSEYGAPYSMANFPQSPTMGNTPQGYDYNPQLLMMMEQQDSGHIESAYDVGQQRNRLTTYPSPRDFPESNRHGVTAPMSVMALSGPGAQDLRRKRTMGSLSSGASTPPERHSYLSRAYGGSGGDYAGTSG